MQGAQPGGLLHNPVLRTAFKQALSSCNVSLTKAVQSQMHYLESHALPFLLTIVFFISLMFSSFVFLASPKPCRCSRFVCYVITLMVLGVVILDARKIKGIFDDILHAEEVIDVSC